MNDLHHKERGAAVVEFALLVGLLLIFFFGIVEFGFIWYGSNFIANAAREGARVAAKIEGTEASDVDEREAAAIQAVETYLKTNSLLADLIDNQPSFLTTEYTRNLGGTPTGERTIQIDIDGDGDLDDLIMAEVKVTIQSHMIWEPVLWPLINLIPGVDYGDDKLRELSQISMFSTQQAIENLGP